MIITLKFPHKNQHILPFVHTFAFDKSNTRHCMIMSYQFHRGCQSIIEFSVHDNVVGSVDMRKKELIMNSKWRT
jgi:hypothetical protein